MKRLLGLVLGMTMATQAAPAEARGLDRFVIDYEVGPLGILQNDNRYGANGTLYSADLTAQNRNLFLSERYSGEAMIGDRHMLALLYAPFDVTTQVQLDRELIFRGTTFPAGTPVSARYQFEGYRVTYHYGVLQHQGFSLALGGAVQIRNAIVSFADLAGTRFSAERDIGLVPAFSGRARWSFPDGHSLTWDALGLSSFGLTSAGGGILDTAVTLGVPVADRAETFVRIRYLAGGADVPSRQIYNWAQFVSITTGFRALTF